MPFKHLPPKKIQAAATWIEMCQARVTGPECIAPARFREAGQIDRVDRQNC